MLPGRDRKPSYDKTPAAALASVTYDRLCPGSDALAKLQQSFR